MSEIRRFPLTNSSRSSGDGSMSPGPPHHADRYSWLEGGLGGGSSMFLPDDAWGELDELLKELSGRYQWRHFWAWVGFWGIWAAFLGVVLFF